MLLKQAVDKIGAGDAMLSLIALSLKAGFSKEFSLLLSSMAGAQSVEEIGNKKVFKKQKFESDRTYSKISMKKVLITGGAGYVGSLLTPFLLKKGYKITVLDLMIYGKSVIEEHKNLKIFVGDIRDQNLLKKILPNHDAIIHLACISNDPSFELNPSLENR